MRHEKNRSILVIDDNRAIHDDFRKILGRADEASGLEDDGALLFGQERAVSREIYQLDSAHQGEEGYEKVRQRLRSGERYSLAFVDMRMPPGWDGLETIQKLWEVDPEIQIVMCTAYSDYSWDDIIQQLGTTDRLLLLKKPFDTAEVCQLACALTEKWHLAKRAHLKLNQLKGMVEEQTNHLCAANRQLQDEVAERKRSEVALKASEDRYALAAAGSKDGLWDWDLVDGAAFYSSRWKSLFGLLETQIKHTQDDWFSRIHDDDLDRIKADLAEHLDDRVDHFSNEHRARQGRPISVDAEPRARSA